MGVGDRDAPAAGATDMPYPDATGDRAFDQEAGERRPAAWAGDGGS